MNAFPAKNASVRVIVQDRMLLNDFGLLEAEVKLSRFQADPEKSGDPLEFTLLVCRAESTVYIMDGHEKTKGALLETSHSDCVGSHRYPLIDLNRAGRHRPINSFDFNKAEPA
jgi:hypothetical protein